MFFLLFVIKEIEVENKKTSLIAKPKVRKGILSGQNS